MILRNDHFTLSNFEGSLDFLLCLIQKEEIDIYDISIEEIINKFIEKLTSLAKTEIDQGAEFIGVVSYLVWLKSIALLPTEQNSDVIEEAVEDPHFEMIHHLLDYCHFKQCAKELTIQQHKQEALFFRGIIDSPVSKKPTGIDHLSLEDLSKLFSKMIERCKTTTNIIEEETWKVSDKINLMRDYLKESPFVALKNLFSSLESRLELITLFLAILELMKTGELTIVQNSDSKEIFLQRCQKRPIK